MKFKNIDSIAKQVNISKNDLYNYGKYIAKVTKKGNKANSKVVLVTAMTPTKAGEGKTTTAIALTDGLNKVLKDKKAICALRQPSMGPVFGMKGGATGGGKASIYPEDDININFTGDFHAITAVNNLISAMITNSIYWGNPLNIDINQVVFPRALDVNDRSLRNMVTSIDKNHPKGIKERSVITAASEIMAIFCLAKDEKDFIDMVNQITIAYTTSNEAVKVADLKIDGAISKIIKQALYPNLVESFYYSPVFVHGGPFANIAHGCCSYRSLTYARSYADYVITEAGFGSDLGAEKYLDILCNRHEELIPNAIVLVASIRSLKLQAGVLFENLVNENVNKCIEGLDNLNKHIENLTRYGIPLVININRFPTDTKKEINNVVASLKEKYPNIEVSVCDSYLKGALGAIDLANKVILQANKTHKFNKLLNNEDSIEERIKTIATQIYGCKDVEYSLKAKEDLKRIKELGFSNFDICISKTPLSLSDDPKNLNYVKETTLHIDRIEISSGARFLIPISGSILRMPGLPKVPNATKM